MKKDTKCPFCSHPFVNAHTIDGKKTKARTGDLAVCSYCATMLQFSQAGELEILKTTDFLLLHEADQQSMNDLVYTIVNKHK